MQVVLIDNIERVGKKGQTIKVTEGYARNYLFPRNLAVPMTPGTVRHLELMKKSWQVQEQKEKAAATQAAAKLEGLTIRITKKAGDKGRLFGSVTTAELAELISSQSDIKVDRKQIQTDHLKELGQHDVVVKIAGEIKATVKVLILPEEAAEKN